MNKKPEYQAFDYLSHGNYILTMEYMRKNRLVPLNMAEIAKIRVNAAQFFTNNNFERFPFFYCSTPDAIAYCDERVKIIKNCELLLKINETSVKKNGGLVLDECLFSDLPGKELDANQLIFNKTLTKNQAKNHEILKELLGKQLDSYLEIIFPAGKIAYNHDKMIGIYMPEDFFEGVKNPGIKTPMLRALVLEDFENKSSISCNTRNSHFNELGRFVVPRNILTEEYF